MKKVTRESKRRLVIFGTISVGIILYFLVTLTSYVFHIYQLEEEEKKLGQDLIVLQQKGSNLKTEIQKLKDPDYVARYARENYLYSKNGEYVIKIEKNDETKIDSQKQPENKWYWLAFVFFLLLLLIIFLRKRKQRKKLKKIKKDIQN